MHPETISAFLHAVPFRSFEVRMNNDRRYLVDHPELLSFTRDRRTAIIADGEHASVHVAISNICSLEPYPLP